ncbi:SHOCT domain-containing protein [Paenibacillus sp. 19GGS1-52]|uniref:SHOCT domain-containing protein n=1 Tax=Paenibacillus sp. 19GGS1-52 TaxID=2758563 RepID=UPI001EFB3A94|nr:SHOCT domain-containing protein [Paenibacillus sp. 19GGS1-52]ULO05777.1 SHOCT domain-containing protein [Paenibacillus sp. 19GGS1-52]
MMSGYGNGMGGFGMLFNLLIIIGVVYVVIRLVKGEGIVRTSDTIPEKILAERYATGEITDEEYIQMKKILRD